MKRQPTRRRTAALQHQRSRGDELRAWLQDKASAVAKRRAERAQAKAEAAESVNTAAVAYFVQHTSPSYAMRRAAARPQRLRRLIPPVVLRTGGVQAATPGRVPRPRRRIPAELNEPYRTPVDQLHPGRGASRRLRKELQP